MLWEGRWIKHIELTDQIQHHKYDIKEYALFTMLWSLTPRIMPGTEQLLNSSCKMTCIIRWTSTSKSFICSKEGDDTDQKRPCGQSSALPHVYTTPSCTGCALCPLSHILTPVCGHLCSPPPQVRYVITKSQSLFVPRPIYAESICNSTSLDIMQTDRINLKRKSSLFLWELGWKLWKVSC